MRIWERVVKDMLEEFSEQQYGFILRRSTTNEICALRVLMEKYRGQKELRCFFVDLEKTYDRIT